MGCGLAGLLGICLTSLAFYTVVPGAPRDAAHGFLADVRAENWSAALQRMGAAYQQTHAATALADSVKNIPALARHTSATFWTAAFEGDACVLDGTIEGPDGEFPIAVELRRVDGYWYVEHVVVQGVALE
jgi:hypothetical protein